VVEQVIVTPADPIIGFPGTVQLSATALDGEGEVVSAPFTWSSSSTAIATVSSTGLVTGPALGGLLYEGD
jgi:hypothetical protein